MKKFLFILIIFIFISNTSKSQDYTIKKGEAFSPPNDSKWAGYVGENTTNVFLFRIKTRGKGTKYFLESIDKKTLQKQYEKELPLEEETTIPLDPAVTSIRTFCLNDKIQICISGYSKKEKLNKYFIKTINTDGSFGRMEEIISSPDKISISNYVSKDKTKLLLVNELPWSEGKQNTSASLYDVETLEKIWTKQLPDQYKDSKIESYYYNLDNSGNLCFLFNYLANAETKQIGIGVGFIQSNSQKARMFVLPNEKKYSIENGRTMITEDKFIFTGLFKQDALPDEEKVKNMKPKEAIRYAAELKTQKQAGTFSYLVDIASGTVKTQFELFPEDVAQKLDYAQGLVEKGAGNKYYTASELTTMNGDFYLIENHKYTISGDGIATYEREFVVTKINSSGEIKWTKIFPKNTVNNLNTFNIVNHKNSIYLFYLEHPKNLENSTLETYNPQKYSEIRNYNGSVVIGLVINPDGTATRKQIFENKGWCYDPQPFNILLEKDNSLLIRMINKGEERFDILKID
jgi:hypothetical protein